LRLGNALPSTPLSRILSLGFSLGSSIADAWSRLRYRRAELRRLAPVSLASDADAVAQPAHWIPDNRRREGAATILLMPTGARIAYRVTLPDHARVVAHCDVSIEQEPQKRAEIEFSILALFESGQVERSWVVTSADGGRILSLPLQKAGPATIVLAARAVGARPQPAMHARWDNPRVEWPRPSRDLMTALGNAVRRRTVATLGGGNEAADGKRLYRLWVRENEPSRRTLRAQREHAAADRRLFTLITLLPDTAFSGESRTRASLFEQSYPHWEWLLVTSGTDHGHAADAARDPRVRIVQVDGPLTPAARLNQALASARGEFVGLVDDLDVLAPSALFEMSQAVGSAGDADVLYSDEDRRSDSGERFQPAFKPDWSPDLLLSCNYVGRLAMMRTATAIAAGGFRDGFGRAYEWELLLRLSRSGVRFRRVVGCLYHRHEAVVGAEADERNAVLLDHGKQLGLPLRVDGPPDESRVHWRLEQTPTVSVIIPNRNAFPVLKKCVDGILESTSYPNRELIVVDNGSTDRDVLSLYGRLEREGRGRIVPFDRPFNFSAACNAGAAAATGDLLLFLNNDIEVVDPDWLEELVRWAQRPGVGVVGAQLLYPDRMIQHAGVVFGLGLVGHIFGRAAEKTRGVFGSSEWYRNYMAVTGACQMVPRSVFEQLGGYDERLRLSFSDVVLCMEAWKAGYRVVYTPHARLIHHESLTRQKEDSAEDMELFARYLSRERFVEDPYLHPHLNPESLVPAVRPPFERAPRQVIADFVQRVLAAAAVR
jgi:GT2 family glycosyltransferase